MCVCTRRWWLKSQNECDRACFSCSLYKQSRHSVTQTMSVLQCVIKKICNSCLQFSLGVSSVPCGCWGKTESHHPWEWRVYWWVRRLAKHVESDSVFVSLDVIVGYFFMKILKSLARKWFVDWPVIHVWAFSPRGLPLFLVWCEEIHCFLAEDDLRIWLLSISWS